MHLMDIVFATQLAETKDQFLLDFRRALHSLFSYSADILILFPSFLQLSGASPRKAKAERKPKVATICQKMQHYL